jgi:hypothetical protein
MCDDRASRPTAVFQQILTRTLRAILYCRGKGDALNGLVCFSMILSLLDPKAKLLCWTQRQSFFAGPRGKASLLDPKAKRLI